MNASKARTTKKKIQHGPETSCGARKEALNEQTNVKQKMRRACRKGIEARLEKVPSCQTILNNKKMVELNYSPKVETDNHESVLIINGKEGTTFSYRKIPINKCLKNDTYSKSSLENHRNNCYKIY